MLVLFFVFRILLNGRVTAEILLFGVVIAAAVFAFVCKFAEDLEPVESFLDRDGMKKMGEEEADASKESSFDQLLS